MRSVSPGRDIGSQRVLDLRVKRIGGFAAQTGRCFLPHTGLYHHRPVYFKSPRLSSLLGVQTSALQLVQSQHKAEGKKERQISSSVPLTKKRLGSTLSTHNPLAAHKAVLWLIIPV